MKYPYPTAIDYIHSIACINTLTAKALYANARSYKSAFCRTPGVYCSTKAPESNCSSSECQLNLENVSHRYLSGCPCIQGNKCYQNTL